MSDKLKIELGGGTKPRDGFLNIDCRMDLGRVDHVIDLEALPKYGKTHRPEYYGDPSVLPAMKPPIDDILLPFDDGSVGEVYSAHCLEHVANLDGVLYELGRVCCHGAKIEIHVPHYLHPDALCPSHKHVIGQQSVKEWTKRDWSGKRFDLVSVENVPSLWFEEAKLLHPGWTADQIMRFVPGTAFEVVFILNVRFK